MYQSYPSGDNFSVLTLFIKLYSISPVVSLTYLDTHCQGLYTTTYVLLNKSPISFVAQFGILNLALYASDLNHVFGQ